MEFNNVLNIAYLGPQASFSEMARDEFCKKYNIDTFSTPLKTIKEVVEFVDKNPMTLGVIPVENSIDGTLRASLDNLIVTKNPNINILSEIIMPIEYCLLSRTTEFYSITGIIGTPYLLGKCQQFIREELPLHLNIIENTSISECAKELSNYNLTYGSIGNKKTAETFRLNVLKENINDDKSNKTRYILIGDFKTEITNNDKTTIAFTTQNTPGALLEILKIFLENNINLTYISSRPSPQNLNEYMFIVSFDGHILDENISRIIEEIRPKTSLLRCLGSYEKIKVDDLETNMI